MHDTIVFIILCSPLTNAVSVQIDGKIDLGPKWNYELQPPRAVVDDNTMKHERKHLVATPEVVSKMIEKYAIKNEQRQDQLIREMYKDKASTNKTTEETYAKSRDRKVKDKANTVFKRVTQYEPMKYYDMYVQPIKVKHDAQIMDFTKHIYKQSLKVFDSIKEKTTDEMMKREVEFLSQSYEEKFGDFVRQTQNQKIKTRLGRQKVIINTLDTSNRILTRLVNYLMAKMGKSNLRNEVSSNAFQNEVRKKMEIEKNHICKKFGICRSQDGLSAFLVDLFNIILNADDTKIKIASDALTEVLKYTDFSHIMDVNTEKHFQKGIADVETYDTTLLRPIFYILKNVVANKNKPIEVIGEVDKRVNKTVGLLEMIEALEHVLPANEKNRLEWSDMKSSLADWKDGKRSDITEIMQSFVDHLKRGIDTLDKEIALNFDKNINLLLGFL